MVRQNANTLRALSVGVVLTLVFAVLASSGFLFFLPWYHEHKEMSSLFYELKCADKTSVQTAKSIVYLGGRGPLQPPSQDEVLTSLVEKLVEKDERAVPWLIDAMKDEDDDMRLCAVFALGRIGPKSESVVPLLLPLMNDGNDTLRCHVASALKRIAPKNKSAIPVMIAALQDNSPTVRSLALSYLKEVGPDARRAVPALIKIIQTPDQPGTCIDAMHGLGEIGPEAKAAVPALLRAQRDGASVADAAARAVTKIGTSAVPTLVDALQNGSELSRIHAANLLGRIGSQAVASVPALVDALQDESRDVRYAAVRALGNIGPDAREAVVALIKLLQDEHSLVRNSAEYSLKQIAPDKWRELAGN